MRTANASAGFTIVELTLVIAVMIIVAMVGAPKFFAADEFNRDFSYEQTRAALRYAQKLAVASGCEVMVRLTLGEPGGFTLWRRDAGTQPCESGMDMNQAVQNPATGGDYQETFPAGILLDCNDVALGTPNIIFDAIGRISIDDPNSPTPKTGNITVTVEQNGVAGSNRNITADVEIGTFN